MQGRSHCASLRGVQAETVTIEVQLGNGLPGTTIIGLPDSSVRESRERIKAAITNSGLPYHRRKILINLAPAHTRKEGPAYDLAIAMAILSAQNLVPAEAVSRSLFFGELALDGGLRPVRGLLAAGAEAHRRRLDRLVIPHAAREEGRWIQGLDVFALPDLGSVVRFFLGQEDTEALSPPEQGLTPRPASLLEEIRGQQTAKDALILAAAGKHHLLLSGPPGGGKTLLARCLPGLLPEPSLEEAREIFQVQGCLPDTVHPGLPIRPFRSPHHTIGLAGFLGGGPAGRPGEITLAHHGVLFLDELPEFPSSHLEALRQPLEDKQLAVGRARYHLQLPANFQLVAAMNPCPCGFRGHPIRPCSCSPRQIQRYRGKVSGPLQDRLDLLIDVPSPCGEGEGKGGPTTQFAREQIVRAGRMQAERFQGKEFQWNSEIPHGSLDSYCPLKKKERQFLRQSVRQLSLSGRGRDRCLRTARTLADLEGKQDIEIPHLARALAYRSSVPDS